MIEPDGLEAGTVDIGSDSGKKRMHGKRWKALSPLVNGESAF
jgi:hypothetical protein